MSAPEQAEPEISERSAAGELDFGQGRRLEAQLAMRAVLGRLEKEPFTGSRLIAGQVVPQFTNAEDAGTYYRGALEAYLEGLGAQMNAARKPEDFAISAFGLPSDMNERPAGVVSYAPCEDVLIHGKVPGVAVTAARQVSAQIVEACAEMLRVLLATAVVGAAEDCDPHEGVVVFVRQLQFGGRASFETDDLIGLGRARVLVHTSHEPRASYLLGGVHGKAPRPLVWEFPYVDHVYGPNRLRWRDLRSPDYAPTPECAPKVVVPS